MLGFESFDTVKRTLCGIEVMHMLHKAQIESVQSVDSEVQFICEIMSEAA